MFNFSGSEIVFILLLALIILGPEKLPEAMRRFGQTYNEIKKLSSGFQSEFKQAFDEPMREMQATADELRRAATFSIDTEPVFVADPAPTAPVAEPAMSAPASLEPDAPAELTEQAVTDQPVTGESAGDDDTGTSAP